MVGWLSPICSAVFKLPRRWHLPVPTGADVSANCHCDSAQCLTTCLASNISWFVTKVAFYWKSWFLPVHTSLLCRQDDVCSHSNEKRSSGVWKWAWVWVRFECNLSQEVYGNVFEGNTLPALLRPYQGSGCFIYNGFSYGMQKAPACYSCIEHAEIILIGGTTGEFVKLCLMTEWQSSPVRAFNMISWRIIFLLPMRLKEAQGRGSLGFICFVFNWFWRLKPKWK